MNVMQLESRLLGQFPAAQAEPWDNVGLLVGDPLRQVDGVMCALDATSRTVHETHGAGCNVLLTHHPVYIKAPESITPDHPERPSSGSTIYEAARLGVSIISLHTNFDRSLEARSALARIAGFEATSSLENPNDPDLIGYGCLCTTPVQGVELQQLAIHVSASFGCEARYWGDPARAVHTIALLGGSLGAFGGDAIRAGADVVITGEAGYHTLLDLDARGLSVILLGHDVSEMPFCAELARQAHLAGVPADTIHTLPARRPWRTATKGELA